MSTIPTGYKRTEGGIIPVEWLEHTIGELIEFEGGSQPDKSVFRSSWKPGYVRLIQIRDYKTDRFETYIPAKLARRFCGKADIMIGRYGPPVFQILRGIEGAYNVALIKAKPLAAINSEYAYYFLKQDKLFGFIEKLSQRSSGQTGVDLKELRQYPLPLPPTKAEQEAIAEALSDADALIESLEQLLAKKRHLQQAAMQELLTGKKRLPGFSGEWKVKPLGSLAHIKTGSRNNEDKIEDGAYPFFVRSPHVERINTYSHECEAILVPGEGNIGNIFHYINGRFDVHQRVYAITQFSEETSGRYIYFYLAMNFGAHAMQNSVKATVDSLRLPTFQNFEIAMPPTHEEQVAIAVTLSDIDVEIADLEAQLAKTRALKQGMMQKLLTGEIRLI